MCLPPPWVRRVYDYDTISANDPIGKVYISLNPLLAWDAPSQLAGWYPIYDTLRGIVVHLNGWYPMYDTS